MSGRRCTVFNWSECNEASGFRIVPGYKLGDGYMHVIHADHHTFGVDVEERLKRERIIEFGDGTDERAVAKREKEVLLLPGTVLVPKHRRKNVFVWEIQ